MRLPLIPPLSTKDGTANKNARLTNCLKESKKTGDKAVIRPGLVLDAQASGVGNGLVSFNGELVSVYGSTLGIGVNEGIDPLDVMVMPLDGTITDRAGHSTTGAASGNFSSVQVACGSQSYLITNGADHITLTAKSPNAFAVGATDFTVEGWIYYNSGSATLFRYTDGADNLLEITITALQVEVAFTDEFNDIAVSDVNAITGTWAHIAAVSEYAGDLTLYINGIGVGSVPAAAIELFDVSAIQVGGGNAYFNSIRFYNGAAYTGDFTPACYLENNSITALTTITGTSFDFAQSPL